MSPDLSDQRALDYNSGFKAGQEHTKPSPETKARMEALKHEIDDLRKEIRDSFNYSKDKLEAILLQTTKTNGRVDKLDEWKLRTEGGAMVLKGVWGVISVYVIGASIALFNMYTQFQTLNYQVNQILNEQPR